MSSASPSLRIIELLAARICHDLVSPVGAVNNGVELIEDLGGAGIEGEAMGLIARSARTAAARLRCFRYAYGTASPGLAELRETATAFLAGSKVTLDWRADRITTAPGFGKLALAVVMLGEQMLGQGGRIVVDGGAGAWQIGIGGRSAGLEPGDALALAGYVAAAALTPRSIHPYLVGMMARDYGIALAHTSDSGGTVFRLTPPAEGGAAQPA